jgi:hypothetical protein
MLLIERKTDYLIFFDFLLYSTIPYLASSQTSCFLIFTRTHSFQNKDGQFVNVSRAQVSSQQKKVACAGV